MCQATLWNIYKQHGIKYKIIQRAKKIMDYNLPSTLRLFETMERLLKLAQDHGQKVVFLDEAVFTFNTFSGRAWQKPHQCVKVVEDEIKLKPVAFIAAVSADTGLEKYLLHPRSIAQEQFIQFLEDLSKHFGEERPDVKDSIPRRPPRHRKLLLPGQEGI